MSRRAPGEGRSQWRDPAAREVIAAVFRNGCCRAQSFDLGSLDGRVTTGEEAARERMQDLLNHAIEEQP